MKHCIQLILCALLLGTSALHAQIPQMIAYQGRVAAGGVNFHGTGQFKFAIVRGNYGGAPGEPLNLWSNDGSLPSTDATNAPTGAVSMTCDRGLYSVLLGNTAAGMVAVPPSVFANPDVRLRVWFNDGTHGWQKLTPDQRLVSVGYAMMADSATTAQTAQTVSDGAITTAKLANGSITAAKMGINSVTASALANGSVTVGALADGHISTIKLADGSVTNAKLATGAVNSASILDATITSADIFDGTIGTADLANGSVTAAKIAAGAVVSAAIADLGIATADLADASVTNAKLSAGAVGTQQIQTGAVRGLEILDGSVGTSDLATSAVTAAKVAVNTLTAAEIAASAITSSELADGAVSSTKIAADAVTGSAIATGAVGSAEIAVGAVQMEDLDLNSVGTAHIVDGTIQTGDLANNLVTVDKVGVLPAVSLSSSTSLAVYSSSLTTMSWSEDVDTANMFSSGAGTVVTAPVSGVYALNVQASIFIDNASGLASGVTGRLHVLVNGTNLQLIYPPISDTAPALQTYWIGGLISPTWSYSYIARPSISRLVRLNAGDQLSIATDAFGQAPAPVGLTAWNQAPASGRLTLQFVSK